MPVDPKSPHRSGSPKPGRQQFRLPAVGIESEFNVWLDGKEIVPEKFWKHPKDFIDAPVLHRTGRSSQVPSGGAVYFDRGVIEVVTPVIELARGCSARAVRSLWEQIGFVRDQLDRWEKTTGHHVRLRAYSTHYNVSYDVPRYKQTRNRNEKRLALLLAYILPFPLMILGANRRSTGIGVRPRGGRIEITADFTPDPAMMIAVTTAVVGICREVISWPSYRLSLLRELPLPTVAGVHPGKHTTRKGWLTKDFHYPTSPFTADIDARVFPVRDGRTLSARQIATETIWFFRKSIRQFADPFSWRLIFSILEGKTASMLELPDRPAAYDDVGRLCRWGMVIEDLRQFRSTLELPEPAIDEYARARAAERDKAIEAQARNAVAKTATGNGKEIRSREQQILDRPSQQVGARLIPDEYLERRRSGRARSKPVERRATSDRRQKLMPVPFPDRRLKRSAYEQVFLRLVSGKKLRINGQLFTPVGMKGWYQAIFRCEADGKQRLMTIDQLVRRLGDWT